MMDCVEGDSVVWEGVGWRRVGTLGIEDILGRWVGLFGRYGVLWSWVVLRAGLW